MRCWFNAIIRRAHGGTDCGLAISVSRRVDPEQLRVSKTSSGPREGKGVVRSAGVVVVTARGRTLGQESRGVASATSHNSAPMNFIRDNIPNRPGIRAEVRYEALESE